MSGGGGSDRKRKSLSQRRSRVVPVVTRRRRRRWLQQAGSSRPAAVHLHYLAHREEYLPSYFAKNDRYPYPGSWLARGWRWYVGDVWLQSLALVRRNGRFVRDTAGVPVWRQRLQLLRLSLQLPTMPENYYKFELYRPENRVRAGDYLHRHETKGVLFRMLTATRNLDEISPLTNKTEFVRRAESAGLSATPILAVLADGEVAQPVTELPRHDLFVKPQTGRGGSGAQVWVYDADADSYQRKGSTKVVARADLLQVLGQQSKRRALIVQPRLANHPDIVDVALDAVPTCRMITITNENGQGEPVIAVFRMPSVPDKVVDNIHAGGVAAPIDLASGVLGKATDLGLSPSGRYSEHPQTGARIEGRVLPHWDDVLKLATEAHHCFTPRVIAGWDISIGPTGPILIEGNAQPCVDLLQRPHDLPLGTHRFGELLAHHLDRRFGHPGS